MSNVTSLLYYGAPLTPTGREDDWQIDALSRPPEILWNFRNVAVETLIHDLRTSDEHPRLDDTGFERLVCPTMLDQRALARGCVTATEGYQRETESLLLTLTGAQAVKCFDATLRREDTGASPDETYRSAHLRVHVDQTPKSAWARAASHGGGERQFRRLQILNVWRPLLAPVLNFPLALCSYRTLDLAADLVATQLHFPDWLKDRENYSLKHNPSHRWYYWKSLAPDEVIIFKCYDSASRGFARSGHVGAESELSDLAGLCPHTAFFDDHGPKSGMLRISLELRALVFYD